MAASLVRQIDQLAECSVCAVVYDKPKLLPCHHTFCSTCIEGCLGEATDGDMSLCPLCRQPFRISRGEVEKLPENLLVKKIVEVKKYFETTTAFSTRTPEKKMNDSKISKSFYAYNREATLAKLNKFGVVVKRQNIESLLDVLHHSPAKQVHCDFRTVVFLLCLAAEHKSHHAVDRNAKRARHELKNIVSKAEEKVKICKKEKENVTEEKETFLRYVLEAQETVCNKVKKLTEMVNRHGNILLQELQSLKTNTLEEFSANVAEIDKQLITLDRFVKSFRTTLEMTTSANMVQASDDLRATAVELQGLAPVTALSSPIILYSSQAVINSIITSRVNVVGLITTADYPAGKLIGVCNTA